LRSVHGAAAQRGAVLVEATIGLGILLYLLFAGFDFIRLSTQLNSAQWALSKAARWSSYADLSSSEGKTKAQVVKDYAVRIAQRAGLSLDSGQIEVCNARVPECNPECLFEPGELYVLRVRKEFTLISLLGLSITHEVEALGQREPST
jgi:hypothetical protein